MGGVDWEISYEPDLRKDVILIDTGDEIVILTKQELEAMLEELKSYE